MFDPNNFRCETRNYLVGDYLSNNVSPNFNKLLFNYTKSWSLDIRSILIESIILRISIGEFWFYEESNNLLICIDGHKRLQAIKSFMQDEFALEGLNIRSDLNGLKFSTFSRAYQRRIEQTCLLINYISANTNREYKKELIQRLKGLCP